MAKARHTVAYRARRKRARDRRRAKRWARPARLIGRNARVFIGADLDHMVEVGYVERINFAPLSIRDVVARLKDSPRYVGRVDVAQLFRQGYAITKP